MMNSPISPDSVWYFYYDEGVSRVGGRMVTIAAKIDPEHVVSYGASVFRKERSGEHWIRKAHRATALGRLTVCPQTFLLKVSEDAFEQIRREYNEKMRDPNELERVRSNYDKYCERKNMPIDTNLSSEEIYRKVVYDSLIRDYLTAEMRKQTRAIMFSYSTKSKRTKSKRTKERSPQVFKHE